MPNFPIHNFDSGIFLFFYYFKLKCDAIVVVQPITDDVCLQKISILKPNPVVYDNCRGRPFLTEKIDIEYVINNNFAKGKRSAPI